MIYDLSDSYDRSRFKKRVNHLYKSARLVEVVDVSERTRSQNNYCHLAIGIFACEIGETRDRVKDLYFKRDCNKDIFVKTVYDKVLCREVDVVRSTASLTVEEMSRCIDAWIMWCADKGVVIPPPTDEESLRKAAVMVSINEKYLKQ